MNILDYALSYQKQGWFVFPLKPKSKKPATAHGLDDASNDPGQIQRWWFSNPEYNIGINCGLSKIIVVDVDIKPNTLDAYDTWKELCRNYSINYDTIHGLTGGGGHHFIFRSNDLKIPCSIGKLAPGIDIKAEGGYIVAPPSIHPDTGKPYLWEESGTTLLDFPIELASLLKTNTFSPETHEPDAIIPEGERNKTLWRIACSMRRQGMSQAGIEAGLREDANVRFNPPPSDDDIKDIAKRSCKYTPANFSPENMHTTDLGNAQFMVDTYSNIFHYCKLYSKWLIWTGSNWRIDTSGMIKEYAIDSIKQLRQYASVLPDPDTSKRLLAHSIKSESNSRINAMIQLAEGLPGISINPEDLDRNGMMLNCQNGVIDLRTGALLPHKKEFLFTKTANVEYNPDAKCPMWERFLYDIMLDRQSLIDFIQRMAGYSITADISEQCFFILYGGGENGKTTFVETIKHVLNDYATIAESDTLLVKRSDGIPNDLASLKSSRLTIASETSFGRRLNESLVKQLTGGGEVKARFLYGELFGFTPMFKIWMDTNHKPVIRGTDHAIWRRVRLIPFEFQVDPLFKDKHLGEKLLTEKEGILNWLVQGCLKWQQEGLSLPQEIVTATNNYRDEEDTLADFLSDNFEQDETAKTTFKEIYAHYQEYCRETNSEEMSQQKLGKLMSERGYIRVKSTTGDKKVSYKGLRLKNFIPGMEI